MLLYWILIACVCLSTIYNDGYEPKTLDLQKFEIQIQKLNTQMSKIILPNFSKTVKIELNREKYSKWKFFLDAAIKGCHPLGSEFVIPQTIPEKGAGTYDVSKEAQEWADDNPDEKKAVLSHIYTQLCTIVFQQTGDDDTNQRVAMSIQHGDAAGLYLKLLQTHTPNTKIARFTNAQQFFTMTMGPKCDVKSFNDFVDEIRTATREVAANPMFPITDEMQLTVLIEGVRFNHGEALEFPCDLVESDKAIKFEDAVDTLRPYVARIEKRATEAANKADGKKPLCYAHRDYGKCPGKNNGKCPFDHSGPPGKKKCPKCQGDHSPKHCPKGSKQTANYVSAQSPDTYDSTSEEEDYTERAAAATETDHKMHQFWNLVQNDSKQETRNVPPISTDNSDVVDPKPMPASDEQQEEPVRTASSSKKSEGRIKGTYNYLMNSLAVLCGALTMSNKHANICLWITMFALLMSMAANFGLIGAKAASVQPYSPQPFNMAGRGFSTNLGFIHSVVDSKFNHTEIERAMMANTQKYTTHSSVWSVDSACTVHICAQKSAFNASTLQPRRTRIQIANGSYMTSTHVGEVTINTVSKHGTRQKLTLDGVLYVPQASSNLISVGRLLHNQNRLVFDNSSCTIINKQSKQKVVVPMTANLFDITDNKMYVCRLTKSNDITKSQLWHNRLAHASMQYIKKAVPAKDLDKDGLSHCEACVKGGIKRRPYNKGRGNRKFTKSESEVEAPQTENRMDKVMADTCTPYPQNPSNNGNKHFFIILDIHTRKSWVRFAKSKSDFPAVFKQWLGEVQNETKLTPILFMPDGGTEFTNNQMRQILKDNNIQFMTTCAGNPNQNGFVERVNGVVLEKMRKLLEQANLPPRFWEDAVRYVVEIQNAMPHRGIDFKTPNSMWSNKPDKTLERSRTFGCEVWYLVNNSDKLRKGTDKYRKGMFLGTSVEQKGWRVLDLATKTIVNTRDAYFVEHKFPYTEPKASRKPEVVEQENDYTVLVGQYAQFNSNGEDNEVGGEILENEMDEKHNDVDQVDSPPSSPPDSTGQVDSPPDSPPAGGVRRSTRRTKPVDYTEGQNLKTRLRNLDGEATNVGYTGLGGSNPEADVEIEEVSVPNIEGVEDEQRELAASAVQLGEDFRHMSRKKIMDGPLKAEFTAAEERELECIKKHGTWTVVKRPKGRNVITSRWVYDVKRDGDNNITVYKARLTAHGFKQREGEDFNETFAAVAQMKSFRATVALSRELDLRMTQIDISNAFLHGELEEEIYMEFPEGVEIEPGHCLKLEKGLYGLKQAGRIWNSTLVSTLKEIGFKQLVSDTQVFCLNKGKSRFVIGIHVDDITMATNSESMRSEVMAKLREKFLVKDLGDLTYYLGIKVATEGDATCLSQPAYVEKLIHKFNMMDANPCATPGVAGMQLSAEDCPQTDHDKAEMKKKPYRSLVGSLMYAYISTRPDIGSALMQVAAWCQNPGKVHWRHAKRILRYAKSTMGQAIRYAKVGSDNGKVDIIVYCDSDWAQDINDRKSISGYVVKLAGGPISWQSKKQATRAMSACEAEFISLTEATKEVLWLTYFLTELGVEYNTPQIFTDSQSAMEWTKNAVHHQRTKHVALKYFFIRDEVRDKRVKIQYISTDKNQADLLTKVTGRTIFERLRPALMGAAGRARAAFARVVGMGVRRHLGSNHTA